MAQHHHKHPLVAKPLLPLLVVVGVLVWVALLISPIGSIVAVISILGLIVVLYILGCISVQGENDRS